MSRLQIALSAFFVLLLAISPVLAQDDCPLLVESALGAAERLCTGVGRNQACYGNINLQAEAQPDAPRVRFEEPGDIADVGSIRTLRLDGMNVDASVWGI